MLSYNIWEDYRLLGMNFNELTEALYDKLLLPMAGLLVALFTGLVHASATHSAG